MRLKIALDETLITPRKHGQLMKRLLRELWEFHRDIHLDKHFQVGAESRYGLRPRSKRYQIRKARVKGHQKPLVWSGRTQSQIKQNARITATQHRATLTARNYFRMPTNLRRDLEAIAPAEEKKLIERLHRRYTELVRTPEYARKRRRRS